MAFISNSPPLTSSEDNNSMMDLDREFGYRRRNACRY